MRPEIMHLLSTFIDQGKEEYKNNLKIINKVLDFHKLGVQKQRRFAIIDDIGKKLNKIYKFLCLIYYFKHLYRLI